MDRHNWYYRFRADVDWLENFVGDIESTDRSLVLALTGQTGVGSGFNVTERGAGQDFSVDISSGVGYDPTGRRFFSDSTINLAFIEDESSNPIQVVGGGNDRVVSIYAQYALVDDPGSVVVDGFGANVYTITTEEVSFHLFQGTEAGAGTAVPAAHPGGNYVKLADVTIHFGDSTIANADIDESDKDLLGLTIAADTVGEDEIDWGFGAGQVSAEDVPVEDTDGYFTSTDVENALVELAERSRTNNPVLIKSDGVVTWDGADLVFGSPIELSFRVSDGEQINRFGAGTISLSDGQVVVVSKDYDSASPVTLSSGTYASPLAAGEYAILAESSLTGTNQDNEIIVFRRNGTNLECPLNGAIYPIESSFFFGQYRPEESREAIEHFLGWVNGTGVDGDAVLGGAIPIFCSNSGGGSDAYLNFTDPETSSLVTDNFKQMAGGLLKTLTIGNDLATSTAYTMKNIGLGAGRPAVVEERVLLPVISDGTDRHRTFFGLNPSTSVTEVNDANDPTYGIYFDYIDTENSGNWTAVARNTTSNETRVDTGVAVAADTWYVLRLEISADGSEARFHINGSLVATITTNLPHVADDSFAIGAIFFGITRNDSGITGTQGVYNLVDYIRVK